jgi:hypothetical protein
MRRGLPGGVRLLATETSHNGVHGARRITATAMAASQPRSWSHEWRSERVAMQALKHRCPCHQARCNVLAITTPTHCSLTHLPTAHTSLSLPALTHSHTHSPCRATRAHQTSTLQHTQGSAIRPRTRSAYDVRMWTVVTSFRSWGRALRTQSKRLQCKKC